MSVSVLPSQFKPTKRGYKSYLKAKGFNYDGINTPMFALSFPEFLSHSQNKVDVLEKRLDVLSEKFYHLTYVVGQDEYDSSTDAYHLNINIKKLVYQLDELTK